MNIDIFDALFIDNSLWRYEYTQSHVWNLSMLITAGSSFESFDSFQKYISKKNTVNSENVIFWLHFLKVGARLVIKHVSVQEFLDFIFMFSNRITPVNHFSTICFEYWIENINDVNVRGKHQSNQ